ncbi:MAG TPA: hypothetical protein VHD91_12145 [Gaiellaceae bacterium]|nr:hypothetical protein [Gaiellaceae bacterium]
MRRLLRIGVAAWLGRWLALEAASFLGRRRPPHEPSGEWTPGRMPRRHEP